MFDRRYEKLQILGSGAYGTALLVRERAGGGTKYVAKEINAAHLGEKERQLALAEADVLQRVCHANIIRYVESFMEGPKLYIVMEYADNGDLATQIKRRSDAQGRFTEDQIMHIHLQLILALSHIHDCKILHRDLKPLNIFLTRRWIVKLGDFGISKVLESTTAGAQTTIGTPLYLAPEICNGDSYGVKSDLWALGVVTYELAALQVPFQATSMVALIMKVCSAEPAPLPAVYSQDLAEIVSGLLEKEPRKRLALEDVLRLGYARHHMQSLLERSRDMAREVQAPVRTQKPAPHPLAPGSPASQDPAQAVRNEYFLNKEIARRNKERCRGPASLSPERSDPRPDPSLQVPRAAPRAASAPRAPPREPPREPPEPEDKRAEVRRRSQEARAAEEAAWKKRLEEARRQVVQDKMVAKQRMEQDYRSRFGGPEPSERSVSSDASPNATRPSERRSESERSGSSDLSPGAPQTPEVASLPEPEPEREEALELRTMLEAALQAAPKEGPETLEAVAADDLDQTLLPPEDASRHGSPVKTDEAPERTLRPVVAAETEPNLAQAPPTMVDERPIRPATQVALSAILENTQDSLLYTAESSVLSSLERSVNLDASSASQEKLPLRNQEVAEEPPAGTSQTLEDVLPGGCEPAAVGSGPQPAPPDAPSVITLHMSAEGGNSECPAPPAPPVTSAAADDSPGKRCCTVM